MTTLPGLISEENKRYKHAYTFYGWEFPYFYFYGQLLSIIYSSGTDSYQTLSFIEDILTEWFAFHM